MSREALQKWRNPLLTPSRIVENRHLAGYRTATATWDPASIAAAAQATTTVTVTGARLGDTAMASFSLDLQGMQMTAYVSAANTVTVVLRNGTAAAIDLASGTLRATVLRT